jgi:Peptidase S46
MMQFSPQIRTLPVFMATMAVLVSTAFADEGMWLFNDLPVEQLREKYGFTPTDEWAEHLAKSCVRFNVGGSASFVSSNGLVLTNHHVGSDTLYKLSTPDRNLLDQGYLAKTRADELKAPDLELNQLIEIRDVTKEVRSTVTADMSTEQAVAARRAVVAKIESEATRESGLRSDVVTLYGGARYHLYQYRKYTDVRLVWAPEAAAAFFGGDADNFEYPRYCLDACIFRVYENDKPAKIEHFLKWSDNGPAEGELTFVAGNPGRTSRIFTTDALKYQRDSRLPDTLNLLRRLEVLLQQFSLGSTENARRARDDLFGVQNARKARLGMLAGLQDPQVFQAKRDAETKLLKQINSDPKLQPLTDAWTVIRETTQRRAEAAKQGVRIRSQLFTIARNLVQIAAEDQKPSGARLPRFAEAGRASLLQQLFSDAPVYTDLDQIRLADSIAYTLERRGADDPLCQQILAGKSPTDRAAELIHGTALADVANRKTLADGGPAAIDESQDPLIQFARLIDPELRRLQELADLLAEQEKQAYAKIAEAKFATEGTAMYPDATFTLRLAFGPVVGYELAGKKIPAWTTMSGAFEHQQAHKGQDDYSLPKSWHVAQNSLNGNTPLNFVSTADIIGGNSGSPVVNRELELVGLIFDGNIQSLTADFVYSDTVGRAVSVHSSAIREALEVVYGADRLAEELGH